VYITVAGISGTRAVVLTTAIVVAACTYRTPATSPIRPTTDAWGPFARQCITTRVLHYEAHRQLSPLEQGETTTRCTGFYAEQRSDGSVQITASTNAADPASPPIVSRIVRYPNGFSRAAQPTDTGVLAYGSDVPETAATIVRDIGLTRQQLTNASESLRLPLRLHVPFPIDAMATCRSGGEATDHGRKLLVLDCTLDQEVTTDRLQARLHLVGTQDVDLATGVRLSTEMNGWLDGRERLDPGSPWQQASDHRVWYSRETEFE
jgi:hypothetical protein